MQKGSYKLWTKPYVCMEQQSKCHLFEGFRSCLPTPAMSGICLWKVCEILPSKLVRDLLFAKRNVTPWCLHRLRPARRAAHSPVAPAAGAEARLSTQHHVTKQKEQKPPWLRSSRRRFELKGCSEGMLPANKLSRSDRDVGLRHTQRAPCLLPIS